MSTQPQLDQIHHVAIPVSDIAASVAWYREQFHCDVAYQDATWALLKFANISLALVTSSQHPPHIALIHPDAAQFGPLTTHRDATRSIYIPDPDSNQVEVMDAASVRRY
ncbi:glyoxalase [Sulfuriferula sp. AH1]|uniref:VOC family protein n=1 Tax=Sulfuriferula sp. AH1 TaxID=1985873 RepID=UPI000B3BAA28|nr:VOC family protein [Sulfuriferula sp. AH1]ARU31211.1 glyoxalase [Sulfuriferula sp. AH1]